MTIAQLTEKLHDETGLEGAELEMRVHFIAMLTADAMGNKAIGDYFQRRMRDCFDKTKKEKGR